jgi:chaperonin cofactor prefoldin
MNGEGDLERLTEAVDRLIVKLEDLRGQRNKLSDRVDELEKSLESQAAQGDPEGYNLLRIHSARLLRERQEMARRLREVLEKLEKLQQRLR